MAQQQPFSVTSASSSRIQLNADHADVLTDTELDKYELLKLTVQRQAGKPLGLALAQFTGKPNRSLSRSSVASGKSSKSVKSKKSKKSDETLPVITSIDADSPAELSGLRRGDLILEINGKATNGQSNKKVGDWIKNSANSIEFLVSREKPMSDVETSEQPHEIVINHEQDVREIARQIAQEAVERG